ncbi:MAG TPA: hypothetical protein ENO20_12985 [Bacteroides sp.]|nr:hypothetical protein [Bacteroides sp.]
MRNQRIHIAILIFWIILPGQGICHVVQSPAPTSCLPASWPPARPQKDSVLKETYALMTDRSIYISGENIRLRIFNRSSEAVRSLPWSDVLHVELITPNGTALAREKISVGPSGGTGTLTIPQEIASGTHYLKAYTSWMRNCGPGTFTYLPLRIIDPFTNSVLEVDTAGSYTSYPGLLSADQDEEPAGRLLCALQGGEYGSREKVEVGLAWNDPARSAMLCVSVSMEGTHGAQYGSGPGCSIPGQGEMDFIPETRDVAMTGTAVSGPEEKPVPYAIIYVSVLGEDDNFYCCYSDSEGRFYLAFPDRRGREDLFISARHEDYEDIELLIDQDFSNGNIRLPSFPVLPDDSDRILAAALSVNAQVMQQYAPGSVRDMASPEKNDPASELNRMDPEYKGDEMAHDMGSFYGQPSATIRFDDFIRLANLEEYFMELVHHVVVRKSRSGKELQVLGNHPDLGVFKPLVMIDGVAIFDVESLLGVAPGLVERIEVVNAPYVRGDVTFGGIVNVITRDGNLGYIDLPSSGLLVDYQMLLEPPGGPPAAPPEDPHFPDLRNTLYWNSSMDLDPGAKTSFSFYTSDAKGKYEILIRGYDDTGKFLEKSIPFEVK